MHIESDSHHLSASFNYLNEIRNVRMQIFSHLKGIWSIRMQILTIRMQIQTIPTKFLAFECKMNRSNEIRSIRLHILTIVKEV